MCRDGTNPTTVDALPANTTKRLIEAFAAPTARTTQRCSPWQGRDSGGSALNATMRLMHAPSEIATPSNEAAAGSSWARNEPAWEARGKTLFSYLSQVLPP